MYSKRARLKFKSDRNNRVFSGGKSQKVGVKNEKIVMEYYEKQGGICLNMHDTGMPDLLYLSNPNLMKELMFIEVKAPTHKVHLHQRDFQGKLKAMGAKVNVVLVENGKIVDGVVK